MTVFLSHAKEDEQTAAKVENLLRLDGCQTWRFQRDMVGAKPWNPQLPSNIEKCEIFLFCISQFSQTSKICQKELQHAALLQKPIVPVKVQRDMNVPLPLNDHQWVEFDDSQDAAVKLMQAVRNAQPIRWEKIPETWKTWNGRSKLELSTGETITAKIPLPRIRRDLTDLEQEEFLFKAFREIRAYFGKALKAFENADTRIKTRIRDESDTEIICEIYIDGEIKLSCMIWKSNILGLNGIAYNEKYGRITYFDRNAYNVFAEVAELEGNPALEFTFGLEMFNQRDDCQICHVHKAAECIWRYFTRTLYEDESF